MKISVILPIYNVAAFLPKSIDSLVNQNYDDYEIILVNDGSTDRSREICERYQKKYDKIILVNQENQGSGIARNTGLQLASGEYIFFCDPDDYITGEFFQKVEDVTADYPDLVVFGYWDEFTNKKRVEKASLTFDKEKKMNQKEFRKAFSELFKMKVMYTLWNKVYKKTFLEDYNISFGNAPMGQDTRFNLDVYKTVQDVKIVPDQFYHYVLERPGSSTHKYRDNLLILKLEELKKLEELLVIFDKEDKDLIKMVKSDILVSSCNNIVNSELPLKSKQEKIVKLLSLKEFDNIYDTNHYMNSVNKFFLSRKYIRPYIIIKQVYTYSQNRKG